MIGGSTFKKVIEILGDFSNPQRISNIRQILWSDIGLNFEFRGLPRDLKFTVTDFIDSLFAIEYQPSLNQSWVAQLSHQSSIFPSKSPALEGTIREFVVDRGLGQSTDILTLGVKQMTASFVYFFGISEDMTQTRNEIDFLLFFGVEWQLES